MLSIKLAASAYVLLIDKPEGLRIEPLAIYLINPVGAKVASKNSSVPVAGSSFTCNFSLLLAPTLYPVIVAAGRLVGVVISSLPVSYTHLTLPTKRIV